ncbi:MAG: type II toxin-antitoxin system prevent-host-death family antitoxin [Bacteroidetes bacterium QS_8_68_28]|nr:MAG: type II toxin-antitoxin system prevent-host-death family antitoxin [Bacteroidetes bacterium QS_8_68_28]
MYDTSGVDAIATITELRSETSDLIDYVRTEQKGVLIQKNNEPHAVLLDWATYQRLTGETPDAKEGDRPPKQRAHQSSPESEKKSAPSE